MNYSIEVSGFRDPKYESIPNIVWLSADAAKKHQIKFGTFLNIYCEDRHAVCIIHRKSVSKMQEELAILSMISAEALGITQTATVLASPVAPGSFLTASSVWLEIFRCGADDRTFTSLPSWTRTVKNSLIALFLDGNPVVIGTVLLYRWVDDRVYWMRVTAVTSAPLPPASRSSSAAPSPSHTSLPIFIIRPTTILNFQVSRREIRPALRGREEIGVTEWLKRIREQFADGGEGVSLLSLLERISNALFAHTDPSSPSTGDAPVCLFYGVAGSGKTKLAKSIASTAPGVNCSYISCSEIFKSTKQESLENLCAVFDKAKSSSPAILILDEFDVMMYHRHAMHEDIERSLATRCLKLLDDFFETPRVFLIAIASDLSKLDEAIFLPGRVNRQSDLVHLQVPSVEQRQKILQLLSTKVPFASEKDRTEVLSRVASSTHGYTGADLDNLVRATVLRKISRKNQTHVTTEVLADQLRGLTISEHETESVFCYEDFLSVLSELRPSLLAEQTTSFEPKSFEDLQAVDDVIGRLKAFVVKPFREPELFTAMGADLPRGVLLYGPTGTGKTHLALAAATAAKVNTIVVKGSEIINKLVGESEKSLARVFAKARLCAPCIVFIDQVEFVASRRGRDGSTEHTSDRILSCLLTEMDGIQKWNEPKRHLLVLAVTSSIDSLDEAVLRPGRFEQHIAVLCPSLEGRERILRERLRKMPVDADVISEDSLRQLAKRTEGCTGADLEFMCNEAAMSSLREDISNKQISMRHFEIALRKVL